MTNLEFIKRNKIHEIVDDLITNAIYADANDLNWQTELYALKWLFQEKETYGKLATYVRKNEKFFEDEKDLFNNLPFALDEEGNEIV